MRILLRFVSLILACGPLAANADDANPDVAPLFVLHEYPGADHRFNMNTSHQRALVSDSRDRAIAQLRQYLPDR